MAYKSRIHESFEQKEAIRVGSERGFGLVFAAVFILVGLAPLIGEEPVRLWALGVGGFFALTAFVAAKVLKPLNILWFKFGMVLHHVVTPLVMGLIFFVVVTPTALMMRVLGKRPLDLDFNAGADSYWIARNATTSHQQNMKRQF